MPGDVRQSLAQDALEHNPLRVRFRLHGAVDVHLDVGRAQLLEPCDLVADDVGDTRVIGLFSVRDRDRSVRSISPRARPTIFS